MSLYLSILGLRLENKAEYILALERNEKLVVCEIFISILNNFSIQSLPMYIYSQICETVLLYYLAIKLTHESINYKERNNIYINAPVHSFYMWMDDIYTLWGGYLHLETAQKNTL